MIRSIPGGWNPGNEGIFEVDQSPGDILFLSSGDTELMACVAAWQELSRESEQALPTLRCSNLGYLKQELTIDKYLDDVVAHCRLVVVRLLGGVAYYRYLVEQLCILCEASKIPLILLPGHNEPDPELAELSCFLHVESYPKLWTCFTEGGVSHLKNALKLLCNAYWGFAFSMDETERVPDCFCYHPDSGLQIPEVEEEWVAVIAYRAHYLSRNLAPFDQLCSRLEALGQRTFCVFVHTLRDHAALEELMHQMTDDGRRRIGCILNTTSFSTKSINSPDSEDFLLGRLDVPILQGIMASTTEEIWREGSFGLPPTDIAMNVALPEIDGRIITTALSFKSDLQRDEATDSDLTHYVPHEEGILSIVAQIQAWMRLRRLENREKHLAVILPNYPNKDARLANGVGLDTPESTTEILKALFAAGYELEAEFPQSSGTLMDRLTRNVTNDHALLTLKQCEVVLDHDVFLTFLNEFPSPLKALITEKWGAPEQDPYFFCGKWKLSGFVSGNVFIAIQPSRGFNLNPSEAYHCPELPPPWYYLAFYCYVRTCFCADAVIHVGKHGNLEWLPGKSVALGLQDSFPNAIFGDLPHFYPFIVNDPGEGTQAKRRSHAVIIDHLTPPLTRAETYGALQEMEHLIDEYYEAVTLDPNRAGLLRSQILDLVEQTKLNLDLELNPEDMDGLLFKLDGYLCELKEAQIRDGLHILGKAPGGAQMTDLLIALHRLPQGSCPSILRALASDYELPFDPLNCEYAEPATVGRIDALQQCRTWGDVVAALEEQLVEFVNASLSGDHPCSGLPQVNSVLQTLRDKTYPLVGGVRGEIDALLHGLNGQYIPSGPSGAPTRGRMDVLPTGRNFYSVDLRAVPTQAACELGWRSAELLIQRYLQEQGEYPESVGLSVWGTATMRTGGDDIAQALALMGVRPVWQKSNRRVIDFEVISIQQLGRPRVDVTLRISGLFRDAFPDLISLFNAAVKKVAEEEEPNEYNPIRRRVLEEQQEWIARGLSESVAQRRALFRVFGSKPGAYGAGLQELMNGHNWSGREDLANVYLQWGGYAYEQHNRWESAHEVFRTRLGKAQIILQNQDNREHDLLDSDDYYQFHGGMANAASVFGENEKQIYFGDHSRPENPRMKTLREEILKVYRSRVVNPKWISGVRRHGYKGAFEMAATVDYLFGYDATTGVVEDFIYEGIARTYLLDLENRAFLEKSNPWALRDMSERLLEASQRGLWKEPDPDTLNHLQTLMLESEGLVEDQFEE
ncbi:MAG: cobaltochelatase subunit CobN [Opitutales bacterium]|nr:cobaltochelatase subunit CobN [Opitutales bacterium]